MHIRTDLAVAHGVEQRVAVGLIGLSIEFAGEVRVDCLIIPIGNSGQTLKNVRLRGGQELG